MINNNTEENGTISNGVARTSVLVAAMRTHLSNQMVSLNDPSLYKPFEQSLVREYSKFCPTKVVNITDPKLTVIDPYALFFLQHQSSPDIMAEFFFSIPKVRPTVVDEPMYQGLIKSGLDVSSVGSISSFFKHVANDEQVMLGWMLLFDLNITVHLAVRTKLIDEFVLQNVPSSIKQVVILGSGLDTRAQRLPFDASVIVFEVDLPEVVEYKRNIMKNASLAITPISMAMNIDIKEDLRNLDKWTSQLVSSGLKKIEPTLWILEGLLMYLKPEETTNLLKAVSSLSSSGSAIVFQSSAPIDWTAPYVGKSVFAKIAPELFSFTPYPDELLINVGFTDRVSTVDDVALIERYGTPGIVLFEFPPTFQRYTQGFKP
ncbi:hypothetical protein SAMD00019534_002480, partial [Acytostelium subglobosum LB1]|uniref:hypothetical protein n=1 Tax=Acytostelium subglobosum LB1 TaxID=1410327 RepID=UPI000644D504